MMLSMELPGQTKKRENPKQVNGCNEGGCVRVGMREEDRSARLR